MRAYWSRTGDEAEEAYWENDPDADDDAHNTHDDTAYLCHTCWFREEFSDMARRTEQDIVCAFVAADCSLSDEDAWEDVSECVHAECEQA